MISLQPHHRHTITNNTILPDVSVLRNAKWSVDGDYFFLPDDSNTQLDPSQPATTATATTTTTTAATTTTTTAAAAAAAAATIDPTAAIVNLHPHHHSAYKFAWRLYSIHDPHANANADRKVRLKLCSRCGETHNVTESHHTRHTGGAGAPLPVPPSSSSSTARNNSRDGAGAGNGPAHDGIHGRALISSSSSFFANNAESRDAGACDSYHLLKFNIAGSWASTVYRMNLPRDQPMDAIFVASAQNLLISHFQSSRPTVSVMRVCTEDRRRNGARNAAGGNDAYSDDSLDDDDDESSDSDDDFPGLHAVITAAVGATTTTTTTSDSAPLAPPAERTARWCFSREIKTSTSHYDILPSQGSLFSLYNADEERVVFVQPRTRQYHVYDVEQSEWSSNSLKGRACPEFPATIIAACWVSGGRCEAGAPGGAARESGFCLIGCDEEILDAGKEDNDDADAEDDGGGGKGKGKDVAGETGVGGKRKRKAGEMVDSSNTSGAASSASSSSKKNPATTKRRRRDAVGTLKMYWFRPQRTYGAELELEAEFSVNRFPYLRRTTYSAFATGDLVVFYERGNSVVTAYHVDTREWVEVRLGTDVPASLGDAKGSNSDPLPTDAELVDLFQHDGQPYAIMALCIHPRTNSLRYLSYSFRHLARQPKFSTEIGSILGLALDPTTAGASFADFTVIPDHPSPPEAEADTTPILCHAAVLYARWPHFRNMIGAEMLESRNRTLHLPETRHTCLAFLTYLYTNTLSADLDSDPETFKSLWRLGNLYLLYDLVAKCRESLERIELNPANVGEVYRLAVWAPGDGVESGERQREEEKEDEVRPRGEQAVRVKRRVFEFLADERNLKECLKDKRFRALEKELVFEIWANARG